MPSTSLNKLRVFQLFALLSLIAIQVQENKAYSALQVQISEWPISRKIQQPTITATTKDRDGFFWIGTQHGLYRFDGVKLTKFGSHQKGSQWIPVSDIKGIVVDSDGKIIVATVGGGLLVWNDLTQSFRQLEETKFNDHLYITDIVGTVNGKVWVGEKEGVYSYLPGSSTESYSFVRHNFPGQTGELSAMTTDMEGNTYVSFGKDLYKISSVSNSIMRIFSGETNEQIDGPITALTLDQANHIYIGTEAGEIVSIDTNENTVRAKREVGANSTNSILALLFHKESLWIGTNNGLYYSDSKFSFLGTFSHENSGLSNNHVLTLVPEGNVIWIGTYNGLNVLSFVPFEVFNSQNSGVFNDVLAFEEDEERRLWVGTFNGLYLLDESMGLHRHYENLIMSTNVADQRIMTLAALGEELWLGFQQNGVEILNVKSLEARRPPIPMLEKLEVTKILHSNRGRTWIATYNQGLYLIEDGTITSYLNTGLLPEASITILFELDSGELLASSENRIYLFEESSNRFSPLTLRFGDVETPPLILSISQNRAGDIWIGTKDHGLFIWRKSGHVANDPERVQFDTDRSVLQSTIYEIQFDEDGMAWCSTQTGVVKLDSRANILARFSAADGLQGQDFNFGASYRDSLGRIYFGGSNGYNRFYPRDVHIDEEPPLLLITTIGISRKSQIDYFNAIALKNLQLTHQDYFVQFDFSVLDFLDPEKNQYRYMLEGFDHDWIENGTRNSATYTSLPPGEYTLRVQGANSAGIWNREGLALGVQVLPPPWLTWWAFTGYALLLAFLLWLGKRAYDSSSIKRRAQEMLVALVESEERADDEMQEQLEIHDDLVKSVYRHSVSTLNLVGEFLAIKGSCLTDTDAHAATESSVRRVLALALLEDCLYYQNEILLADMNKYTDMIISRLLKESPIAEERITTINEVSSQPFPIEQASALAIVLYELLENSIQHAFEGVSGAHYLHATLVAESAEYPNTHYRLTVQDNGLGIPLNIDPLSAETSGLIIVASMAKKLSGTLTFTIKNGTRASISFPGQE